MTRVILGICAAAALLLAGCAYDEGYGTYAAGYGAGAYDGFYSSYRDGNRGLEGGHRAFHHRV